MVVGIRRALETGRAYAYDEIAARFGMPHRDFQHVFDYLIESGHLRPVLVLPGEAAYPLVFSPFECDLLWTAA